MRARIMKIFKWVLAVFVAAILLNALAILITYGIAKSGEAKLAELVELDPAKYIPKDITAENNAYDRILKLRRLIQKNRQRIVKTSMYTDFNYMAASNSWYREDWEDEVKLQEMEQFLEEMEPQVEKVREIVKCKFCFSPYGVERGFSLAKPHESCDSIFRFLQIRAVFAARERDDNKVIESLGLMMKLGDLITSEPRVARSYLSLMWYQCTTISTINEVARFLGSDFDPEKYALIYYQKDIPEFEELWRSCIADSYFEDLRGFNCAGLSESDKSGRKAEKWPFTYQDSGLGYFFIPFRLYEKARIFDTLCQYFSRPEAEIPVSYEIPIEEEILYCYVGCSASTLRYIEESSIRIKTKFALSMVVQKYFLEKGELPASLAQISHMIDEKLTIDPETKKPVVFDLKDDCLHVRRELKWGDGEGRENFTIWKGRPDKLPKK